MIGVVHPQQAFYRDTAIGHFYLNPDGLLVYWSWGERRRTLKAKQHRLNQQRSQMLKYVGIPELVKFYPGNQAGWAELPGMTYEESLGSSSDR